MSDKSTNNNKSHDKSNDDRKSINTMVTEAATVQQRSQTKRNDEVFNILTNIQCLSFIKKIYFMIETCDSDVIEWSHTGKYFNIKDTDSFASKILPQFFRHNNLPSFIRQLNAHGFRKMNLKDIISSSTDKTYSCYQHQYFVQGRPDLLSNIKKNEYKIKPATRKRGIESIATDVKNLRGKVPSMKKDIETIKVLSRNIIAKFDRHDLKQRNPTIVALNATRDKKENPERKMPSPITNSSKIKKTDIASSRESCQSTTTSTMKMPARNDGSTSLEKEHKIHKSYYNLSSIKSLPSGGTSQRDDNVSSSHLKSNNLSNQTTFFSKKTSSAVVAHTLEKKSSIVVDDDDNRTMIDVDDETFRDLFDIEDVALDNASDERFIEECNNYTDYDSSFSMSEEDLVNMMNGRQNLELDIDYPI